ncbi:MAG: M20/M25/M40 family metallo-hydrolase, partial [Vicinamibacterales bacterium]
MKRTSVLLLFTLSVIGVAAQAPEKIDAAAIARIREQGLQRSKVMDHLFQLTDVHGPRLTGSPGFESAGDWAVATLKSWGLQNARKERWAYGTGWSLTAFHATLKAPQTMPIIGLPKAWSTGTNGTVTAEVVRPEISTAEDAANWKGKLKGKIVLTQPAREVRMLDGRIVLRMNDKDIEEALSVPAPRGGGAGAAGAPGAAGTGGRAGAAGGRAAGAGRGGTAAFNLNQFFADEGVVALFDRGANSDMSAGGSDLTWQTQRTDGGTIFVGAATGGGRSAAPNTGLPQVTLAVEHYNRMVRLLDAKVPVTVELNVEVKFHPETPDRPNGFNIIAEMPGTDLANEIVLIGGHFDSWHGATGATDNATGSAAMMEVLRIFKDAGLKPRRTIRIALWGGEEQGLLGSRAYAEQYLGTPDAPKPGQALHSAYFNLDNGTGKVRGIWMQSNPNVAPIFK